MNRALEMISEELHVSMYPSHRKKYLVVLGEFTYTFCLLLVKQDLNHSAYTALIPRNVIFLIKFHGLNNQNFCSKKK